MNLLEKLSLNHPESSKSTLRKWIKMGRVTINGKVADHPQTPVEGEAIVALEKKKKLLAYDVEILYQDKDLVVLNKPRGLLTVKAAYEEERTVHGALKQSFSNVYPVHRLDRETSGVMVMALSEEARVGLKKQFHDHSIHREYRAIVIGHLQGSGTWKVPLQEDTNYVVCPHPQGEMAITHYKALKQRGKTTVMQFILETGKKNQIRAHCLHAGFPILGDQKYGKDGRGPLHLHAYFLSFAHPITNAPMKFSTPPPFET
ncbi:MAG: RluA family pseudouridine synthase [Chlamydiia bacterium]|nr:RluA family pseudouridine synthase [Chlamydiia bacterium]